jgi:cytochrome P450 family 6
MLVILQYITFCLISVITAIFIGLYFYFTRNFKFWHKLGIPYVKPTPFLGNLKECVLLKTTIGKQLQRIYNEHSDKPYVGIFSFDKPSLLIRDPELVKNILVKDFQTFMDRTMSVEGRFDPLFGNCLPLLKGEQWRNLRTNLTPVFTSSKIKMMSYLMDICGKELADCLEKATADGKLPPISCTNLKQTENLTFKQYMCSMDIKYIQITENLHWYFTVCAEILRCQCSERN